MGSLENSVSRMIVDISAGSDADSSDLGSQGVGQVIAVKVKGSDHVEVVWPSQNLL